MKVLVTLLALIIFPMVSIIGQGIDTKAECPYEFVLELEELETEDKNRGQLDLLYSKLNYHFNHSQSEIRSSDFYDQIFLEVITPPPEQVV